MPDAHALTVLLVNTHPMTVTPMPMIEIPLLLATPVPGPAMVFPFITPLGESTTAIPIGEDAVLDDMSTVFPIAWNPVTVQAVLEMLSPIWKPRWQSHASNVFAMICKFVPVSA